MSIIIRIPVQNDERPRATARRSGFGDPGRSPVPGTRSTLDPSGARRTPIARSVLATEPRSDLASVMTPEQSKPTRSLDPSLHRVAGPHSAMGNDGDEEVVSLMISFTRRLVAAATVFSHQSRWRSHTG